MLKEEIEQYRQPDGLISPDKNPGIDSTGNGILYLSLYMLCLMRTGVYDFSNALEYAEAIDKCRMQGPPGRYQRSKTKVGDQTGRDDYYGILGVDSLCRVRHYSLGIYSYGNKVRFWPFKFVYDIGVENKFTLPAWFGRFPDFELVAGASVEKTPRLFAKLKYFFYAVSTSLTAKDNSSGLILAYLASLTTRFEGGYLVHKANQIISNKLHSVGGMQYVLAIHFGRGDYSQGIKHPIAKYWV